MNVRIEESWKKRLGGEFDQQYFVNLTNYVRQEYMHHTCYPPGNLFSMLSIFVLLMR